MTNDNKNKNCFKNHYTLCAGVRKIHANSTPGLSMGMNKRNQSRLTQLYAATNHTLSVEDAANILQMPSKEVAKLMSRWVGQGHFLKVKRGLYSLVNPDAMSSEVENSWVFATKLYSPC